MADNDLTEYGEILNRIGKATKVIFEPKFGEKTTLTGGETAAKEFKKMIKNGVKLRKIKLFL